MGRPEQIPGGGVDPPSLPAYSLCMVTASPVRRGARRRVSGSPRPRRERARRALVQGRARSSGAGAVDLDDPDDTASGSVGASRPRRSHVLQIKLRSEEQLAVVEAARAALLPKATWARRIVLQGAGFSLPGSSVGVSPPAVPGADASSTPSTQQSSGRRRRVGSRERRPARSAPLNRRSR